MKEGKKAAKKAKRERERRVRWVYVERVDGEDNIRKLLIYGPCVVWIWKRIDYCFTYTNISLYMFIMLYMLLRFFLSVILPFIMLFICSMLLLFFIFFLSMCNSTFGLKFLLERKLINFFLYST